jgi:hypothetical protein
MSQRRVVIQVWKTDFGPGSCNACKSLHNQLFRFGEGPQPPLHYGCRCMRVVHHVIVEDARREDGVDR